MARSCGLRMGPRRFELVVLEGNSKKHKIIAYYAGEFDPDAEDPASHAVELLKDAAKAHRIPTDNLGLVIDSGTSAFRHLKLPFSDRSKMEQIIKFEVEDDLPQWNIDDVVIDYHVLEESDDSSSLLVTAVPKEDLQAALKLLERAGLEPLQAQLETSAMVNAAASASLCGPEEAQLLVHVGELATSVVVMDGGNIREMRVIHIGALTHELALVAENAAENLGEDGAGEAPAVKKTDPVEASRRVDQAIKRIRRELGRTLSGAKTTFPIEAIHVCGIEMPGLVGEAIMDVPVYILDCFDEDEGQPADGFGQLVAAYGAAVTQLGGGIMQPKLRREELAFSGTWERIEFPMAVAAMLLAMLGAVFYMMERQKVQRLEGSIEFLVKSNFNYLVGTPGALTQATMVPPSKNIVKFAKQFRPAKGEGRAYSRPIESAFPDTLSFLNQDLNNLKGELGDTGSIKQPQSAFVASNLVFDLLRANSSRWRTSIHKISGEFIDGRNANENGWVDIRMDVVFYGSNSAEATRAYEQFRSELENQDAWFVKLDEKPTKELASGDGIIVEGLTIGVDTTKVISGL
ncbi:MAG: hypothetical protein ACI9X4_001974 [Glaciecola sp.]|jgi:hypothetical protein